MGNLLTALLLLDEGSLVFLIFILRPFFLDLLSLISLSDTEAPDD